MDSADQIVIIIIIAFAGLAAFLAVGSLDDDDDETAGARSKFRSSGGSSRGSTLPGSSGRSFDGKNRPVFLSVSAGDAEFDPASVKQGKLKTRFVLKNDDVELRGSFSVDIIGGDDSLLKQRIVRYRPVVLALLKRALRSGPPVRTASPVVSSVKPLGGTETVWGLDGDDGYLGAFAGSTFLLVGERGGKQSLFAWTDLEAAPKVLFDPGTRRVVAMAPSPDGARVAVVTGAPVRVGTPTDTLAQLLVVDTVSGTATKILEAGDTFRFHVSPHVAWSTGADRIAIDGVTPSGRAVRILDPATGASVGETPASLGALLVGWERDDRDAVLVRTDGWYRWRPGGSPERVHFPFMMSPDTRFMMVAREVTVDEGGERIPDLDIVRRDDKPWAPMQGEEPDDLARDMLLKDVLEHRVRWLGDHGALMFAPDPMVLDLDSLAARYLLPPMPGVNFVGASPSGKVVVRDAEGKLLWGTAAAWT